MINRFKQNFMDKKIIEKAENIQRIKIKPTEHRGEPETETKKQNNMWWVIKHHPIWEKSMLPKLLKETTQKYKKDIGFDQDPVKIAWANGEPNMQRVLDKIQGN